MTAYWGKTPEQLAAERQATIAKREAIRQHDDAVREEAMTRRINEGRTPEELGAYFASYLPPDAPLAMQCGECHLQPGEECDICGAKSWAPGMPSVFPANWTPAMSVDSFVDQRPAPIRMPPRRAFGDGGKRRTLTGWQVFWNLAALAILAAVGVAVAIELISAFVVAR